jgi:beta-glucosidase/6-phospho-beta-glucosidase/beta-galactosidase
MRRRGLEPIADLMHFGVPDDLSGIGDPRLPDRYRAYAAAFADRYPWVRWYTPVNEPFITAWFSARVGWWNERETSDRAFVRALDNVVTCAIAGMAEIRARRSDAVFLQSDACERFTASAPDAEARARHRQEVGFLAFDLTYGRELEPTTRRWLLRSGMTPERLAWFDRHGSRDGCIVGLDYYEGNERTVSPRGREGPARRAGFAATARPFFERYGLPVMMAETNNTADRAVAWLEETWADTELLRAEGNDIVGYCWYGLTDMVDWDTCLREANDRVNSLGLVDLQRHRRLVAAPFASLVAAMRPRFAPAAPVEVSAA